MVNSYAGLLFERNVEVFNSISYEVKFTNQMVQSTKAQTFIAWQKRHHSVSRIYCMAEKAPFWITNICAGVSQHNLGCNYYTIALIALLWQICAKICIPKEASTTFSKNAFYIRLVKFVANQNIFLDASKKACHSLIRANGFHSTLPDQSGKSTRVRFEILTVDIFGVDMGTQRRRRDSSDKAFCRRS